MTNELIDFLKNSPTAFHATENSATLLRKRGFTPLVEWEDWDLKVGGKYFVSRGGSSLIAFTIGSADKLSFKIASSHLDSPALKLKENPIRKKGAYAVLNVEEYGGGNWQTFLDRPLKIAGRVVKNEEGFLKAENVISPFTLTIPSIAIHQNRTVNEGMAINSQIDLQPLLELASEDLTDEVLLEKIAGKNVLSYDLFLVNADLPYTFGFNEGFLASPRIDNLTSVLASLEALTKKETREGIMLCALLDNEEIGSRTPQGADGDFLENTLRRIVLALGFTQKDYYTALASSFMLSLDNAHALHPNHPEKADPTNAPVMGKGIVIKSHAGRAYITNAFSSATVKTVLSQANIPYQTFFNRSDVRSGSTLGSIAQSHVSILGADIGIAQLAMHSACECFAVQDYFYMVDGLNAFFRSTIERSEKAIFIK